MACGLLIFVFIIYITRAQIWNSTLPPSCPIYFQADNDDENSTEVCLVKAKVLHVQFINFTNRLFVSANQKLNITFEWEIEKNSTCRRCQMYFGFSNPNNLNSFLSCEQCCNGTLSESTLRNTSHNFEAPNIPGLYLLRFSYENENSCRKYYPFTGCPKNSTWGAICVQGDTDEDGVQDCFDNCPCVRNRRQLDSDNDGIGDSCQISSTALSLECGAPVPPPSIDYLECNTSQDPLSRFFFKEIYGNINTSICPSIVSRIFSVRDECSEKSWNITQAIYISEAKPPPIITSEVITTGYVDADSFVSEYTGKIVTSVLLAVAGIFVVVFCVVSVLTARWMIKNNIRKVEMEQMEVTDEIILSSMEKEIVVNKDDTEMTLRSVYMNVYK